MTNTILQFGGSPSDPPNGPVLAARGCPTCGQHFSSDARFCPFDGEPLVEARDYDPSKDPLLGSVVDGRYQVEHVLGEGGMGTVYRVRHVALGKGFAMKALRADLSTDSEIADRFIGEARTAASVSHPGLVEITDFGRLSDGRPYFVMELLEGRALAWLIKKGGALPAARAIQIVRGIAEGLAAAHAVGIVHRDLKPDNIYLSSAKDGTDRVKILDFGLAKVMGVGRRTRQGVVFGTPHYMSPEQAAGEAVDYRADIYSLGIVMYEMITGRVPFEADSFMGVLSKHIYMQPTPPSQVIQNAHEVGALEDVVLRCLEKKPQKRYQSVAELLADVERSVGLPKAPPRAPNVISSLADQLEIPRRGERPAELEIVVPVTSFRPFLIGGVVVVLALAAFLLPRWFRSRDPDSSATLAPAAVSALAPPSPFVVTATASSGVREPRAPGTTPRDALTASPASSAVVVPRPNPARATSTPEMPKPKASNAEPPQRERPAFRGEIVDPWAQ